MAPGIAVSGPPGVSDLIKQDPLMRPISLEARDGTLADVLFQLTQSSPGLAWLASVCCGGKGPCRCELGLMTVDAVALPGFDASARLPAEGQ